MANYSDVTGRTLQDVLTAGSTLTMLNTINTGGFGLDFIGGAPITSNDNIVIEDMYIGPGQSQAYQSVIIGTDYPTSETGISGSVVLGHGANKNGNGSSNNIAIGTFALRTNVTSDGHIAIGASALRNLTASASEYAIGAESGYNLTSNGASGFNTLYGYQTLYSATTSTHNTAIGFQALQGSTFPAGVMGSRNTAVGMQAGQQISTGEQNTFIGVNSGWVTTTGNKNTFLGAGSGEDNTDGGFNTYLGHDAGFAGTSGNLRNVAVGWLALPGIFTNLTETVAVGYDAGINVVGGTDNVFVGSLTGNHATQKTNPTNQILIGADTYSPTDNTMMLGNPSITVTHIRGANPGTIDSVYGQTDGRLTMMALTDISGGAGGSPAGNFGNLQINRNGAFSTPASDSLDFESATGLSVIGDVNASIKVKSPLILGGTSTTADLNLQTTSGVGATGADMHFLVGNNGATEAMTILNNGRIGFGGTPSAQVQYTLTDDGSPSTVTAWDNRHVQWGTGGSTAPGLGMSYSSGTGTINMLFLEPLTAWRKAWFGAGTFTFLSGGTTQGFYQDAGGRVGLGGDVTPSAYLDLAAGTTAANTAPLKFNSGPLQTTPEVGAVEFLTDKYYAVITTSGARKEITLNDAALTSGVIPVATTNGRLTDGATYTAATTYTPTLTNTTNVAASTAATTHYLRIGDWVHVWGTVDIDATSSLTISEMGMSLPVASGFGAVYDLSGTASFEDNTSVQIKADATNDRAMWRFTPQTATNNKYSFHFSYKYIAP